MAKKSSFKNVSANGNTIKKVIAVVLSIIVLIVTFSALSSSDRAARNTIAILRVKAAAGIPAYAAVGKEDFERYDILLKEYTDDMIKADELDKVTGMFTSYYLRGKTPLYRDEIVSEVPKRNEWLYKLPEEEEVVTIPYNYLEAGGDILVPGDVIRIRVSYEAEDQNASGSSNPNLYYRSGNKMIQTEVLFESITVKDILNANSHSIYEVYRDVMKLDSKKRQEIMKSRDFESLIKPKALVLSGTKDDMDMYAKYKTMVDSGDFLITILSRANATVILDELPKISEVEVWQREQEGG